MNWTQVDIYTTTEAIDLLSSKIQDLGIRGCMVQDAQDFQEFLEQKDGRWDYLEDGLMELAHCETCITVYLPEDGQGTETLSALRDMLAQLRAADPEHIYGRLEMQCSGIREEDWANNWKQYFKPFPVGKKLYIKPSWEAPTAEAAGRTVLEIDPASSFGTGQHHTTRLCLELMESKIQPGATRLLDLGCGSGILFIGGLLLGAKSAYAVDIEENAVRIAGENAAENHLDPDSYTISCGNVITDAALTEAIGTGYDVITANIVADVIKAMAPLFPRFLKPDGTLILSGIITERADEVLETVTAQGFAVLEKREASGWCAVKLCRK
ncbi:50S ribosomal protein L11 methyltransferase [uncultured Ruminococcus sp.]|uniref:50S ribosomal protein L11 methyltransferase n=1 Tax=uncultured Ruminococcus sp. TaxID=165186 RepID=UPI002621B1B0|nr:50S ribosomal protein L11 methyltransferase [uncultured Ruminococcus sp.]